MVKKNTVKRVIKAYKKSNNYKYQMKQSAKMRKKQKKNLDKYRDKVGRWMNHNVRMADDKKAKHRKSWCAKIYACHKKYKKFTLSNYTTGYDEGCLAGYANKRAYYSNGCNKTYGKW